MVAAGLNDVRRRIADACSRGGRDPSSVTLVAVSKGQPNALVLEAHAAGQRDFGENRADGLAQRVEAGLPSDIRWHFVGSLQRRKAAAIAGATFLLHSMDRERLALRWVQLGGGPTLMQVNVSREPQKHGVDPVEAHRLAEGFVAAGVDLRGLMTMASATAEPETSRPVFEELAVLRDRIRSTVPAMAELSMGMTDDFEVAVECGATIVRVGRAIFGERPGRPGT